MRRALSGGALAAALAVALVAPALVAAAPFAADGPWATVNVCDTAAAPGAVGVRVFAPRRRQGAQWARVRLQYWDGAARRWRRVRSGGDGGWARLGSGRTAVTGGTTFTFAAPDPGHRLVVRGIAQLEWRRGRRVVARARVRTTAGHADPKDPALADSRASCEIRR